MFGLRNTAMTHSNNVNDPRDKQMRDVRINTEADVTSEFSSSS